VLVAVDGPPILARLALDAVEQFERAADEVPPPGRGGPIGRLSQPGWVIAHVATSLDAWVNEWCGGHLEDEWARDWYEGRGAGGGSPSTPFDEARTAFQRIGARARTTIEGIHASDLARTPQTIPPPWHGHSVAVLLARTVAHLFAHAGELSVTCSLLRRPDLELPGEMRHSLHAPIEEESLASLVALDLDAREAFAYVARALPVPAQAGAFARLNAGGWIVAHIAEQDDQYWGVHAQGHEADVWLTSMHVRYGDEASKPPYAEALDALDRTFARGTSYLEAMAPGDLGRVLRRSRIASRGEQTGQDLLVLQAPHVYALAGELAAIGSLAGGTDPDLPRRMAHTLRAAGVTS
jgi:hypothetical protein